MVVTGETGVIWAAAPDTRAAAGRARVNLILTVLIVSSTSRYWLVVLGMDVERKVKVRSESAWGELEETRSLCTRRPCAVISRADHGKRRQVDKLTQRGDPTSSR